jgi:hypothetical protein
MLTRGYYDLIMSGRTWWVGLAAIAVAVGIAVPAVLPVDAEDYRTVAAQSAKDALSQVRTVRLAIEAELAGDVFDPYVSTLLWQARDTLSTAVSDLASEEVPDDEAVAVQREISPLLNDAVRAVGAAGVAVDAGDAAVRDAVETLGDVGDRLAAFVQDNS